MEDITTIDLQQYIKKDLFSLKKQKNRKFGFITYQKKIKSYLIL